MPTSNAPTPADKLSGGRSQQVNRRINRDLDRPPYKQIADSLIGQIEAGQLNPGDRLPSETDLMEVFGVARMTIRHALQRLRERGLVCTQHGVGAFVRTRNWHDDPGLVAEFAHILVAADLLDAPTAVIYYFEEPWKWRNEHQAWCAAGCPRAVTQALRDEFDRRTEDPRPSGAATSNNGSPRPAAIPV